MATLLTLFVLAVFSLVQIHTCGLCCCFFLLFVVAVAFPFILHFP